MGSIECVHGESRHGRHEASKAWYSLGMIGLEFKLADAATRYAILDEAIHVTRFARDKGHLILYWN